MTKIPKKAFGHCKKLETLSIPSTVKTIDGRAFEGCEKIKVELPKNIKTIEAWAFKDCKLFELKEFPPKLKELAGNAFEGTTVNNISNSIFTIKDGLVYEGTALKGFTDAKLATEATIRDGTTVISSTAFRGNEYLVSLTLPDSVVKIGREAFGDCKNLKTVKLSENLEEMECGVFSGCKITSINCPKSLKKVDYPFGMWMDKIEDKDVIEAFKKFEKRKSQ